MRQPFRLRTVIPVALAALVLPAQAAAHGRSPTVALDYRLALDASTRALAGVHVRVLDGDRDFQVHVDPGTSLLVRGALHEPLLRIDSSGVWVNADSPTATGDRLVSTSRHGWVHLSGGRTAVWHDHRLAPPPASTPGPVGRFVVPVDVNGAPAAISGTFVRVARPALWPWPAAAALFAGAIVIAIRRRSLRGPLTIGLGATAGLAALVEITTFAVRDATTGGVAWLQLVTACVVAGVLGILLLRLRGRARAHAAGVVGAVAAAVSFSSLPVFWHGVVISALPAVLARAVCAFAIVGGGAAAVLSFLPDFDEPVRARRPVSPRPLPR
jgi:hypothetical protein